MLLLTLLFGASDYLHARLLALGQALWPDYGLIRQVVPRPACNPHPDLSALVQERLAQMRRPNPEALLPPVTPNRAALRASLRARRAQCRGAFRIYRARAIAERSGVFRAYSTLEAGVGALTVIGLRAQPYLLVLVIVLCAAMATAARRHIALRHAVTRTDLRTGAVLQVVANVLLVRSAWAWQTIERAATAGATLGLTRMWMGGFGLLALLSLIQAVWIPGHARPGGSLAAALRTVPLYTYLTLVAGTYFLLRETYAAGLMVQTLRMVQLSNLYLAVALYIWAGVLLKHTRFTELVFDVLRPWQLAPEWVTILVVLLAAVPTAFTGASGIFVLALGGVLYDEMRRSGARRSLAMAATAMSGSMGVVLNPCLMIVIISALNRQVTTDQLYHWGSRVFLLSAVLFCAGILLTRRGRLTVASPRAALRPSLRALRPLAPYAAITAAVIAAFSVLLGQRFNAFSAPTILPVILLGLLACDRRRLRRAASTAAETPPAGFWPTVRAATTESTIHIGSLLLLMALSVAVGGVIERSGVMDLLPGTFGSVWTTMAVLVVILVLVGMFIDPYGAIILVSAAIAPIAYRNHINPVHFWMVVLVAFEFGYLMPPVALNHLFARQSVGEAEFVALLEECRECRSFWRRHEHVLLPILVMGTALVLVALVPLMR
ncbi:MAG: TRAP transporter large permease subunit [Acidiferrobacteraceae bacterium]